MIPGKYQEQWQTEVSRLEVLFLADHGGGWPECLALPGQTPLQRVVALRRLGFRVRESYEMPTDRPEGGMEPWVRLTNGVAVSLADGFVSRARERRG